MVAVLEGVVEVVAGSVSDVLDASDVLVGFVSAEVVVLTEASSDAHETTTTARAIETRDTRMDRDGSGVPKFR